MLCISTNWFYLIKPKQVYFLLRKNAELLMEQLIIIDNIILYEMLIPLANFFMFHKMVSHRSTYKMLTPSAYV